MDWYAEMEKTTYLKEEEGFHQIFLFVWSKVNYIETSTARYLVIYYSIM